MQKLKFLFLHKISLQYEVYRKLYQKILNNILYSLRHTNLCALLATTICFMDGWSTGVTSWWNGIIP